MEPDQYPQHIKQKYKKANQPTSKHPVETNVFHMGRLIRMSFWTALLVFIRHMARPSVGREQAAHSNNCKNTQARGGRHTHTPPQEHHIPPSEALRKLMTCFRLSPSYFSKKKTEKLLRLAAKVHWKSKHNTREKG